LLELGADPGPEPLEKRDHPALIAPCALGSARGLLESHSFPTMSTPGSPSRRISRRTWLKAAAALSLGGNMPPVRAAERILQRAIPKTGEAIPAVGLGTWQAFDVAGNAAEIGQAREALRTLVELGGRVIDSSPMYGSAESVSGQLGRELGVEPKLFVATKVWTSGKQAGIRQMEDSMRKLGVERLDLMQVHNLVDASTHLATLREWKKAGRVRYIGVTHYHAGAHRDLEKYVKPGDLDFVQVNYSLAEPEADRRLLAVAAESRTAVIVNRPFAEGAMFSRVKGKPLPDFAKEIACASWAQFFLKWIIAHPAVSCAIPGTRNAKHVADNLGAASGPLPDEPMRKRMAAHFDSL
jgi:diketogulonate reductase-like aldo/keto reductase